MNQSPSRGTALRLLAVASTVFAASGTLLAQPEDFSITPYLQDPAIPYPMNMAFLPAPAGELLVIERLGQLWFKESVSAAPVLLTTISLGACDPGDAMCTAAERGLHGICVDPQFTRTSNNFIYLFHTHTTRSGSTPLVQDRVTRITLVFDPLNPADPPQAGTQTVIWQSDPTTATAIRTASAHFGGDINFHPHENDYLYLPLGDHGRMQSAQDNAACAGYSGRVLRIHRNAAVPAEVVASGLRNPFRSTFHATSSTVGTLYIGDVGSGPSYCTETSPAYEELNAVRRPTSGPFATPNFGWPCQEGPTTEPNCGECTRTIIGCNNTNLCSALDPCNFELPVHASPHGFGGTNCIIVGPVYPGQGTSTPPYPQEFWNRLFIADFSHGWIKCFEFDSNGDLIDDPEYFTSDVEDEERTYFAAGITALKVSPQDNQLYMLIYPSGAADLAPGVYRLGYQEPHVHADYEHDANDIFTVQFTSSVTGANEPFVYVWDFGDGSPPLECSSCPSPTHEYGEGQFYARLIIRMASGLEVPTALLNIATVPRPELVINDPSGVNPGYLVGEQVECYATGTQDSVEITSSSAYSWVAGYMHDGTHIHPLTPPTTGRSFTTPPTGVLSDHPPLPLVLQVTVTAPNGVTAIEEVTLEPEFNAVLNALPDAPVTYTLEEAGSSPPVTSIANTATGTISFRSRYGSPLLVTAPATVNGKSFVCWSDDPTAPRVNRPVPTTRNSVMTAVYRASGSCCRIDMNGDGAIDTVDLYTHFLPLYFANIGSTCDDPNFIHDIDVNDDCVISPADYVHFLALFVTPCP